MLPRKDTRGGGVQRAAAVTGGGEEVKAEQLDLERAQSSPEPLLPVSEPPPLLKSEADDGRRRGEWASILIELIRQREVTKGRTCHLEGPAGVLCCGLPLRETS